MQESNIDIGILRVSETSPVVFCIPYIVEVSYKRVATWEGYRNIIMSNNKTLYINLWRCTHIISIPDPLLLPKSAMTR
jgi:hypothetical protein